MKLVFCWIQWCGKGTQARILAKKYNYQIIEMGAEFRKVVHSGTILWEKIKEIINSGAQVDKQLGKKVMEKAIKDNPGENIIYDGFIRNQWNLEVFDALIPEYKIVFFKLPVKEAKKRLLGRMYDTQTGETFPAGVKVNPKNGNILTKRDDDKDEKAIRKRISEYEEKTLPILEKKVQTWEVIQINADQSIEKVSEEMIQKLGL